MILLPAHTRFLVIAGLLLSALLLPGCSVRQEISLSRSGSGEARVSVELHRVLVEYLADLSGFAGGASMPVFDLDALGARFAAEPGLELISAQTPHPNRLELHLRFADIDRVFDAQGGAIREVFRFERRGEERLLHIRLTPQSVRALLDFSPAADSMLADILLPPADQPMSQEDYVSYLAWALEEYQSETPVSTIIQESSIEVTIRPEGRILSQRGGRVSGDRVVFTIPVVSLLTSTQSMEYSLTFR